MMDPNFHIKVGDFYLSPRGLSDDIFVDLDGWNIRLDHYVTYTILKELQVPVKQNSSWSSWQHEQWEIKPEGIRFFCNVGSSTPTPKLYEKTIPIEIVKNTILQLRCPHFSDEKYIVLKNCVNCIFAEHWDDMGICRYNFRQLKSLVEMDKQGIDKYVQKEASNHWEWGEIRSWMSFKIIPQEGNIPSTLNSTLFGLSSTHSVTHDESKSNYTFTKYWSISEHARYKIMLDTKTLVGQIESVESRELSSGEDWLNLKMYLSSRVHDVLEAFAEICWWSGGHLEPLPLERKEYSKTDDCVLGIN